MRSLFGLTVGFALGVSLSVVGFALAKQLPPVVLDLGPVVPTPLPSPVEADRIRMITSFTLQNKPDGKSIISFEATDFAKFEKAGHRVLASEVYSFVGAKKELRPLREMIMKQIRQLERDLLNYVEQAGPPRAREPITGPSTLR